MRLRKKNPSFCDDEFGLGANFWTLGTNFNPNFDLGPPTRGIHHDLFHLSSEVKSLLFQLGVLDLPSLPRCLYLLPAGNTLALCPSTRDPRDPSLCFRHHQQASPLAGSRMLKAPTPPRPPSLLGHIQGSRPRISYTEPGPLEPTASQGW